jgi:hypothetical protein
MLRTKKARTRIEDIPSHVDDIATVGVPLTEEQLRAVNGGREMTCSCTVPVGKTSCTAAVTAGGDCTAGYD